MNTKIKYVAPSLIVGFILAFVFMVGISVVQAQSAAELGNPLDGAEKSWSLGTIITDWGYLYIQRDENIPSHFYLPFSDRVHVQYEVDGYYFVEKYYECFNQPVYGWIWHENVLLDKDVIYLE